MTKSSPNQRSSSKAPLPANTLRSTVARQAQKMPTKAICLLLATCFLLQASQTDACANNSASREERLENDGLKDLKAIREQRFANCGAGQSPRNLLRDSLRVAGGFDAKLGEYPSYVYLYLLHNEGASQCGGTILSPNIVLTAAHCVKNVNQVFVQPTLWRPDESDYESWYEADKVCADEKYANTKSDGAIYDVAILRLKRPLTFGKHVGSACLAPVELDAQTQAEAVGLGLVHGPDRPRRFAHTLQVLPVKRTECSQKHHTKICFKANHPTFTGDTCAGDSGGPIYARLDGKLTVFAATSSGPETCHKGEVGVSENANIFNLRERINRLIDKCEK